jgi:hypothetical protein
MDFSLLIDIFLHLDKHLVTVVDQWGPWVYVLLFAIIFIETGVVVMPFLPGDSLLFVAGAIAAVGGMSLPLLMILLMIAAIAGDAVNDRLTVSLTNDVTITGEFFVNNSTGLGGSDEGGEIKLANATSAISVLNGPIVFDIYQNKIRFFESGSPNRGAFINLAACSTTVGTDLLAGSSGTDTFARATAGQAFDKANAANIDKAMHLFL